MRTLFVVILFCVSLAYGEDTNITSKVFEKRDKDGKVSFRMETVYRGKIIVMATISRPNKDGVLAVSGRSYLVDGDLVMTEADDDRDGTFETIAVYRPGTQDMEIFSRQPDGSVKPVSTQTLEAWKKQNAAVPEFMDTIFTRTNLTDAEFQKLVRDTQKKIQDAEKEKKENKK